VGDEVVDEEVGAAGEGGGAFVTGEDEELAGGVEAAGEAVGGVALLLADSVDKVFAAEVGAEGGH
jgi:hypothetical protein